MNQIRSVRFLSALGIGQAVYAVSALLWIPQAWLIAQSVDRIATTTSWSWQGFIYVALVVVALGGIRAILETLSARLTFRDARNRLSEVRAETSAILARHSPLSRHRSPSGTVASVLVEQAESIVPWLSRYQSAQWRVAVVPLVILICVGYYSWVAALVLIFSAPLIPIFMAIVGWRAQSASEAQMLELGSMHGFLLDRLRGLATLRAMDAIEATATQLWHSGQELVERTMRVLRIAFLSSAVLELFSALGVAMVAVYIGFHLLGNLPFGAWGGKLSLQQGLFILMLAPAFFEPLRELSAVWHDRANGLAAVKTLTELTDADIPEVLGVPNSKKGSKRKPNTTPISIELRDLVLGAPPYTSPIVVPNITIPAGSQVAITGSSGSGKSLLLAAIAGLLPQLQGEILLNGVAMDAQHAEQLRHAMVWVAQKPHFFTGSVKRNITLDQQDVNSQELHALLQATGIADEIASLNKVPLGEGGLGISGGEALRVALARIAANPNAALILLDEPTVHLDLSSAKQVIDVIRRLAEGKTLLVATHDPLLITYMQNTIELQPTVGKEEVCS